MATLKLNDVTTMTESGGTVTMADGVALGTPASGVLTNMTGAIGSSVTGFTGVKELDWWRVTSNYTGSPGNEISSNLERVATGGFTKIGTGMSHSSGIFSFPSTGIWWISLEHYCYSTGANRYVPTFLFTTVDNGSAWHQSATAKCLIADIGEYGHGSSFTSCSFDVTDTSTHKVKFRTDDDSGGVDVVTQGDTSETYTGFQFMRIGDT